MRIAVMGFGSVWRHRPGRQTRPGCYVQPIYYNTTGIAVNDTIRQRPRICGYARFDTIGGFDPNHLSQMIGRSFECAVPSVWMGYNKLLFGRILNVREHPERFLIAATSAVIGRVAVGDPDWRSSGVWLLSFSECSGQQEFMLLMSLGQWMRSSLGLFVLEPSRMNPVRARLVLQVGA